MKMNEWMNEVGWVSMSTPPQKKVFFFALILLLELLFWKSALPTLYHMFVYLWLLRVSISSGYTYTYKMCKLLGIWNSWDKISFSSTLTKRLTIDTSTHLIFWMVSKNDLLISTRPASQPAQRLLKPGLVPFKSLSIYLHGTTCHTNKQTKLWLYS